MYSLNCFKAYDIRGIVNQEIDETLAYRVGFSLVRFLEAKKLVVGSDVRISGASLKRALVQGILDAGCDALVLDLSGSEEVYFAVQNLLADGGVEITASHNPIEYNGMKLVGQKAIPIGEGSGLEKIQEWVQKGHFEPSKKLGKQTSISIRKDYATYLLKQVDPKKLKPLKVVLNSGNGAAGPLIDVLESFLKASGAPLQLIKIHHEPDGTFPNGIPNPLLEGRRKDTIDAVLEHQADMGVAWDADFDRCFLFDEKGQFIEGYYMVGLLAQSFLNQKTGLKVVHDVRLLWNTLDILNKLGGESVPSQSGHTFMKNRMRESDAIYGGEMSAHHYFKDFAYCDSGMLPWLLVARLLSEKKVSLSSLLEESIKTYPCSGEKNFQVKDPKASIQRVLTHYQKEPNVLIDRMDGLSIEFPLWRLNLRSSNTEPLLRLNLETRGDQALLEAKVLELSALLGV